MKPGQVARRVVFGGPPGAERVHNRRQPSQEVVRIAVTSPFADSHRIIPDGIDKALGQVQEAKDVKYLSYTKQLREYYALAKKEGYTLKLIVPEYTRLSRPLQKLIEEGKIKLSRLPLPD